MIVSYQGGNSFRISQGDLTLAINPLATSRAKSDLSLHSTGHPDFEDPSFVIAGPGEYEVKDVGVKGFLAKGPKDQVNTIYRINFEGMTLCFLGSLASPEIGSDTLEQLENIDILFVPITGEDVLDAAAAYKLAVSLEPGIIIPMAYGKAELDKFIKEGGKGSIEAIDKLVIKKKDLEGKEGEIVVLKEE